MKYTAKAYVRADVTTNISQIPNALRLIYDSDIYDYYDQIWVIDKGFFYSMPLEDFKVDEEFINCNANTKNEEEAIKLFLELAKIKDDEEITASEYNKTN